MAKNKKINLKTQANQCDDTAIQVEVDRENKILNSMVNVSVILMSTLMGAFANVVVDSTSAIASGMVEAIDGKEHGDKVDEEIKQNLPEVEEKMKTMISSIKKDIYLQMRQKEMEQVLSDPAFDVGPKIIEKYDFKLPKLTQELDDNSLTKYSQLLESQDMRFAEMFKELTEWINSLPKPSEVNHQET